MRFQIFSRLTMSKPLLDSDHNTIIVETLFLFGHHPEAYPVFDGDAIIELSGLLESYYESPVAPASSQAPSAVPDSSIVSSVASKSGKACSITCSRNNTQLNDQSAQADSNSLRNIQKQVVYQLWSAFQIHFGCPGLTTLLCRTMALLGFHLIFRRCILTNISIIIADFTLDVFRDVPYPPAETLALVGASVSSTSQAFLHVSDPIVPVL